MRFPIWLGLAVLLSACARIPLPIATDIPAAPQIATVYLVERGWHTDVAVQVGPEIGPLAVFDRTFVGAEYLVFGFGEMAYSEAEDKDFGHMFMALFPSPGIMLVTALAKPPEEAFGAANVISFRVSQPQLDRLTAFVWLFLRKDQTGKPERMRDGPYPGSVFYGSDGIYAASYTCNTWTAEALARAGLPISPAGVLFAGQVMDQAKMVAAGD
jgi:uncharacterized protein (TIGR02117 family)